MENTAQSLRSRLYHLETINDIDMWIEQCEGYPVFKKEDSIYKFRFLSLPERTLVYDIIVDTNIHFERNENGIQWTQIKENEVMAISFKEEFGANAFWQLIEEYQKKYAITVPAAQGILFYFEYKVPDPNVDNLNIVLKELEQIPEPQRHERVVSIFLTKRDLLPKLVCTFKQVDESQDIQKLEIMFKIVKLIFNSSNEELLYELMCNDSYMSILGALEYDPNFKNNRPKHREFMKSQSRLLEVVPFNKSGEMLNLIIFTYRLEYVKECVLFPYLNDYSFACTNYIIKNNYRKIISHIFNPKKKDFINSVFDLLRVQDVNAFKLLRQIFRIAKNIYSNEIYSKIAERDFFEIALRNFREFVQNQQKALSKNSSEPSNLPKTNYKKKKPEQIEEISMICLEILEQFMDYEPQHFRQYCISEEQKLLKYPTFSFLFDQYDQCQLDSKKSFGAKILNTLKILIAPSPDSTENQGVVKELGHQRVVKRIIELHQLVECSTPVKTDQDDSQQKTVKATVEALDSNQSKSKYLMKWLQLFSKIINPFNEVIEKHIQKLLPIFMQHLRKVSKNDQILVISTLKDLIQIYVTLNVEIEKSLNPEIDAIVQYFVYNKGALGIRVSTFLSIFQPKRYSAICIKIAYQLQSQADRNPLLNKYTKLLRTLADRPEVQLPASLKREKTEAFRDDESFDKLQKKVKVQ